MLAVTITATSQGIGDSYSTFMTNGKTYERGTDDNGEFFLRDDVDDVSFKYYFDNGKCTSITILSFNKRNTDILRQILLETKVYRRYKIGNKTVIELVSGLKFMYYSKYTSSGTLYIIETW